MEINEIGDWQMGIVLTKGTGVSCSQILEFQEKREFNDEIDRKVPNLLRQASVV